MVWVCEGDVVAASGVVGVFAVERRVVYRIPLSISEGAVGVVSPAPQYKRAARVAGRGQVGAVREGQPVQEGVHGVTLGVPERTARAVGPAPTARGRMHGIMAAQKAGLAVCMTGCVSVIRPFDISSKRLYSPQISR